MPISKETLLDYKEQYLKALKYVDEDSKYDPPTDPHRSHIAARNILLQMRSKLNNSFDDPNCDDAFVYKVILSFVCRDLGRIYVYMEDVTVGESLFNDCTFLIQDDQMKAEGVIPFIGGLNEMAVVHSNRDEHSRAYDLLIRGEETYNEFKKMNIEAKSVMDVFAIHDEATELKGPGELENIYTMCTYFLAQVCGRLGQVEQSASYCHLTLRRQIIFKSFEYIDFSLNAATLSQYYIGQNMFKEARHHLAAATLIIAEHEEKMLKPEMTDDERADTIETFKHRYADVARCWGKYGLALLSASKDRLMKDDDTQLADDIKTVELNSKDLTFPELEVSAYESRISADYCLTFDDAKLVFHFVINWLDKAKEYYKPDTEATEYAKIMKDYAELYEMIAFFEDDPVNQSKMHKRRAKYYEELLDLLNPLFYLAICRECWYNAGLAYCSILDIKLDAFEENVSPIPQDLHKINQTCQKAIKLFKDFLKSYMEKDSNKLKANIDPDEERTVLFVFFYLGRLYYKQITPDLQVQLDNMQNSVENYKRFVEECLVRKEVSASMQAEIGVCREMVSLLPIKIENLRKRLGLNKE